MKIAITGARGLLGWHAAGHLHAENCAAKFRGEPAVHQIIMVDRQMFADPAKLATTLDGVELILHFAGVNRGDDAMVEAANPAIARQLVDACRNAGVTPHIVYANSTHSERDTPYGRSKRIAGEILGEYTNGFTDVMLPHIFGECAKPFYNNVTATLIHHLWNSMDPTIDPEGSVELLHAGEAGRLMIDAGMGGIPGRIVPKGRVLKVAALWERLQGFHQLYTTGVFPDLSDTFDLNLFNSYRAGGYPNHYPMALKVNSDHRGRLFESAKGGNASHTFLSTTHPGKQRGDHFHLNLVERFVVVSGEAIIRIRKVLTDEVHEFRVSGEHPVAVDQVPLHTHNIENVGDTELTTFFWSHRMFDPAAPDTYADPV